MTYGNKILDWHVVMEKKYFDVKMEVLVPATVVYRVQAESAEQALDEVKESTPVHSVRYNLIRKKIIKSTVYDAGSTMLRFIKNFGAR